MTTGNPTPSVFTPDASAPVRERGEAVPRPYPLAPTTSGRTEAQDTSTPTMQRSVWAAVRWWLLVMALGLTVAAQLQFDANRLTRQWEMWQIPTLMLVIGALVFGVSVSGIGLEAPTTQGGTPVRALGPWVGTLFLAMAVNAVSTFGFTSNTIRVPGLILWLFSLALALYALWKASEVSLALPGWERIFRPTATVSWQVPAFLAVVMLALFFRFYQLDQFPGEVALDQLSKYWDVRAMREGRNISVFFSANQGREGAFFHLVWLASQFVGLEFFTLKLTSALIGMAMIPAMFFTARALFNTEVAFYATILLAVDKWHVILSRSGYRVSLLPLTTLLSIFFLVRALRHGRWIDYGLAGVLLGLNMYTYKSAPFAFLAAGLTLLFYLVIRLDRRIFVGGLLTLMLGLMVYSPMARYAYEYWESYTYREKLQVRLMEEAIANAKLTRQEALLLNTRKSLLTFNYIGDPNDLFNTPLERHFNFGTAVLYALGMGYILVRFGRGQNAILPIFVLVTLIPMVLAMFPPNDYPNIFRSAATLGPALIVAALPLAVLRRLVLRTIPSDYHTVAFSISSGLSVGATPRRVLSLDLAALSLLVVLLLLGLEVRGGYTSVFERYRASLNTRHFPLSLDIANEIRSIYGQGPAFFKYYDFQWIDVGKIEMRMRGWGYDDWRPGDPNAPAGSQITALDFNQPPLNGITGKALFLLNPQDQAALDQLRARFPNLIALTRYNERNEPTFIAVYVQP